MSGTSQEYLRSKLELYFNLFSDDDEESIYNLCGQLKDEYQGLFLGLYHYHILVELEHNRFVHDTDKIHERNRLAFEIFNAMANTTTETIETYYAWYMIGDCYEMGYGVQADEKEAFEWFKKAAGKEIPVGCWKLGSKHVYDRKFEQGIDLLTMALTRGFMQAGDDLVQLYILTEELRDFNKACHWAAKATKLNSQSRSLLTCILKTGQIEWTHERHQCWAHLRLELNMNGEHITAHIAFLLLTKYLLFC